MGDEILDIETNPNRPDTLSIIGIAREVAAITEQQVTLVTWELEAASLYDLKDRHVPILLDLMTGRMELEE